MILELSDRLENTKSIQRGIVFVIDFSRPDRNRGVISVHLVARAQTHIGDLQQSIRTRCTSVGLKGSSGGWLIEGSGSRGRPN